MPAIKRLHLFNRQTLHRPPMRWLKKIAAQAVRLCPAEATSLETPIHCLEEIEISLVDDAEIARVHGEFLDDPTPTDVITFHHGEILVSTETAARQAPEHGKSLDHEIALYMVHGLLHLSGHEDHEPAEAAVMAEKQEQILARCLAAVE